MDTARLRAQGKLRLASMSRRGVWHPCCDPRAFLWLGSAGGTQLGFPA